MNLNVLKYVVAVAEEKSVSRASRKLYVAQPSLSQSIRALEDDLGAKLFDRNKKPIQPTVAGEVFIHWAKEILSSNQRMREKISDISMNRLKKLTIGITPQRSKEIIPAVLQEFYASSAGCSVVLVERVSKVLESLLERDKIDLLIDHPHSNALHYVSIPIMKERILVAAPVAYGLTVIQSGRYPSVSLSELADKPFILLSGNKYIEDAFQEVFKRIGDTPSIILECLSPQVAHHMVSLETGITLIPEYNMIHNRLPGVSYYSINELPLTRMVGIVYRKDRILSEEAAIMIAIIRKKCGGTHG
jgi:DNA-binding transcriptional LysR family regulator